MWCIVSFCECKGAILFVNKNGFGTNSQKSGKQILTLSFFAVRAKIVGNNLFSKYKNSDHIILPCLPELATKLPLWYPTRAKMLIPIFSEVFPLSQNKQPIISVASIKMKDPFCSFVEIRVFDVKIDKKLALALLCLLSKTKRIFCS